MSKKEDGGVLSLLMGVVIAGIPVLGILAVRKIVWPLSKWAGKKAWEAFKAYKNKPRSKKAKEAKRSAELPTPDIFKDSPNLAPAKEFKF